MRVLKGGPIELEQMDSTNPPLAVHGVYLGGNGQYYRHRTEEVNCLNGPIGGGPPSLAVSHRPVLVRAAVCH